MTLKAMNKYLLCKKIEEAEPTKPQLIITTIKEKPHIFVEVLDVGQLDNPKKYYLGQKLLIHAYSGIKIEHEDQKYIMIDEKEVIAELI